MGQFSHGAKINFAVFSAAAMKITTNSLNGERSGDVKRTHKNTLPGWIAFIDRKCLMLYLLSLVKVLFPPLLIACVTVMEIFP